MGSIDEDIHDEAPQRQASGPAVNPAQVLLHAVGRFPLMILCLTALGTFGGLAAGFSQPNTYTSVGLLLLRMGAREAQTPESAVDPNLQTRGAGAATGDELMMLMDPALGERVVSLVGPARILRPYDPSAADDESTPPHIHWVHGFQSWLMGLSPNPLESYTGSPTPELTQGAVLRVAAGSRISAQNRTNTIRVSFTAHDPVLAQLVASTYVDVLQMRHREFYETEDKYTFVSKQLEEASAAAESARAALLAQREEDGIHNLQGRQEALGLEIQSLEAQNRQDEIQLESLRQQLVLLDEQIEETPREIQLLPPDDAGTLPLEAVTEPDEQVAGVAGEAESDQEPLPEDGPPNPFTLNTLLAQLQNTNLQLTALGDEYATTSRYYLQESKRLQARIQSLEGQIRALRIGDDPATGIDSGLPQRPDQPAPQLNPIHTGLVSQRLDTARQLEALQAARAARAEVLADNRKELARLLTLEPIYSRLQRDVDETSQRVAGLQQAQANSATLKLIDSDERMGNLMVTQEPFLPMQKDGPDRFKILLAGVIGGLALGLGLAVARQLLDSRLRYASDTEGALGLRVLGVVPEQRSWRRTGKRLQESMEKRA